MNFMKLFILNVLAIVTCQFSQVSAASPATADSVPLPTYNNRISEAHLSYDRAFLGGTIQLPNGYIFNVVDYKQRDDNALLLWKVGDRVEFTPTTKGDQLFLIVKNLEGNDKDIVEPYVVFDAKASGDGLKIIEVTNKGKFIKLSDNSVWEFSWYNQFSSKYWKVGNRVLIQGDGSKNSYKLINFDVSSSKDSYEATGSFVAK